MKNFLTDIAMKNFPMDIAVKNFPNREAQKLTWTVRWLNQLVMFHKESFEKEGCLFPILSEDPKIFARF